MKETSRRLLTVQQCEALTGRKAATWHHDILTRRIPYVKLGRSVRVPVEVVENLIRQGHRPSVTTPATDVH